MVRLAAGLMRVRGVCGTEQLLNLRHHHLTIKDGNRRLMIAALRYYDTFVKTEGSWLFAERKLYVDWIEQREVS